ncbi:hypothetical protein ANN_08482 [Periplaneta americana]|uniref:Uncharacterized protein n=1 Tax=Periplaneta americana TaxID=6978 RepID=A0ABQ8T2Y8_PERAM|nr:hypothetical protein ANN_08482 [Periplaneta americana]
MAGLCEGGNEPSGSLKAICKKLFAVRIRCFGGRVAQLVELLVTDWKVRGSIPSGDRIFLVAKPPERPRDLDNITLLKYGRRQQILLQLKSYGKEKELQKGHTKDSEVSTHNLKHKDLIKNTSWVPKNQ